MRELSRHVAAHHPTGSIRLVRQARPNRPARCTGPRWWYRAPCFGPTSCGAEFVRARSIHEPKVLPRQWVLEHLPRQFGRCPYARASSSRLDRSELRHLSASKRCSSSAAPSSCHCRSARPSPIFHRQFQVETNMSPAGYVEAIRLDIARRLLEDSSSPIKRIAHAAGFGSTATLRRALLRRVGLMPADYRLRFQTTKARPLRSDEGDSILS